MPTRRAPRPSSRPRAAAMAMRTPAYDPGPRPGLAEGQGALENGEENCAGSTIGREAFEEDWFAVG